MFCQHIISHEIREARSCELRGKWCSGITPAQHAGGPGLNPQRVHTVSMDVARSCRVAQWSPARSALRQPVRRASPTTLHPRASYLEGTIRRRGGIEPRRIPTPPCVEVMSEHRPDSPRPLCRSAGWGTCGHRADLRLHRGGGDRAGQQLTHRLCMVLCNPSGKGGTQPPHFPASWASG